MPIPKRAARDWRHNWKAVDWWDAYLFGWEVISCADEAARQIVARDRYIADFDELAAYHNRLVAALDAIEAKRGKRDFSMSARSQFESKPHLPLLDELRLELRRTHIELAALDVACGVRAFDEDTLEHATFRILLERNVDRKATPYQIGKFFNPDASSGEIEGTSEKVTAQNTRTAMLSYYRNALARLEEDLARAGAGRVASTYVPLPDLIAKWETRAARVKEIVAALTPQQRSANRSKLVR